MSSQSGLAMSVRDQDDAANRWNERPRKIRLAMLNNFIPPYWKPVFTCLAERYPDFRVLVSTPMEPNRSWEIDWRGLDVVRQKTITLRGKWRHPKGFEEALFLHLPIDTISQLKKFQPDVIVSAEMGFRTLLSLAYRKLRPSSRLIVWAEIAESTERGRGKLRHAVRRFLAKHTDAFMVVGISGARYLRSLNVPASEIFIVPYASDVSRFARNPIRRTDEQAGRLLYVGQLIERKGLVPFLQALVRWASRHPDRAVEFTMAGDGPLRDELSGIAVPCNLKLHLLGNVPYDELPGIYANSGVFVFPTLADSWGVVVNEAMASGLPVLGSLYSQAVEMLVAEGQNGWVFQTDNSEGMYGALERCLSTSMAALDDMRQRARDTAGRQTPEQIADLIDKVVSAWGDRAAAGAGEKE